MAGGLAAHVFDTVLLHLQLQLHPVLLYCFEASTPTMQQDRHFD